MKKVGLFLNGLLMIEYPYTEDAYGTIIEDFKTAVEESGEMHEIRIYNDIKEVIKR